jgi:LacI family transcriptional regulator
MSKAGRQYRVAVALNYADPAARDVLDGIVQYARGRNWKLGDKYAAADADGVIHDAPSAVDGGSRVVVSTTPSDTADVRPDAAVVGRIAAAHFLERGFRRFAFVGPVACRHAYADVVMRAGFPEPIDIRPDTVKSLDQPLAVFAGSDSAAAVVADFFVSRDSLPWVAILGVGNDSTSCELSDPPLSSIDVGARRLGMLAAKKLNGVLTGHGSGDPVEAPPLGVVLRRSTDGLAIGNEDVAAAVRFIHDNAGGPLRVTDLLKAVGLDRRTLERYFQRELNRSPALVLRHRRVEMAADLLRNTRRPMNEIAKSCGFRQPQSLAIAFKQITGHSPTDYRAIVDGEG